MKQGKSLSELATELERQHKTKRDFITDTRELELVPRLSSQENGEQTSEHLRLQKGGASLDFTPTKHTHRQIGTFLNIPAKYYDRMHVEAPALLAHNVNHWFKEQPTERMVRTLDGKARAFLSNRYRRLDNFVRPPPRGHARSLRTQRQQWKGSRDSLLRRHRDQALPKVCLPKNRSRS